MKNIEIFDRMTVVIFAKLYKNFPHKINIECDMLEDSLGITIPKDEQKAYCASTLNFLAENGFIVIGSKTISGAFVHVGLTMQGLYSLKQPVPKSIETDEDIGSRMVSKVSDGMVDTAFGMLSSVLMKGIGL